MPIGTYTPPLQNHYTNFFSIFLLFFFHFRCILLQISHKKCFFISVSILGRSGVKSLVRSMAFEIPSIDPKSCYSITIGKNY